MHRRTQMLETERTYHAGVGMRGRLSGLGQRHKHICVIQPQSRLHLCTIVCDQRVVELRSV